MLVEAIGTELVAKLLAEIGVHFAKSALESKKTHALTVQKTEIASPLVSDSSDESDFGETPQFLSKQRVLHRVDLARAKWDWLTLTAYYHPIIGRSAAFNPKWNPQVIAGHFTTADFAGQTLPIEKDIGEHAPSQVRVQILHARISIAQQLANSVVRVELELRKNLKNMSLPDPLWKHAELNFPWYTLMMQISRRTFEGLPRLNSYCGFKNLWTVRDTPASGISVRGQDTPNLLAYSATMEIAWYLIHREPEFIAQYNADLNKHGAPHQFALRRAAVRVLKLIWEAHHFQLEKRARAAHS
jgi:hypothetical protein